MDEKTAGGGYVDSTSMNKSASSSTLLHKVSISKREKRRYFEQFPASGGLSGNKGYVTGISSFQACYMKAVKYWLSVFKCS
jgi:hypothetical protein